MVGFTAAALAAAAAIASAGVSAAGAASQGRAQNKIAGFQAAQGEQQAGQVRATAQRQMLLQRRNADIAASRVKAVSAAGGGATDASILNVIGDIQAQGEYNALSALYNGNESATGLDMQSAATRAGGKQAQDAGLITAGADILKGASFAASLYGDNSLVKKYSPTGGAYNPASSSKTYNTPIYG